MMVSTTQSIKLYSIVSRCLPLPAYSITSCYRDNNNDWCAESFLIIVLDRTRRYLRWTHLSFDKSGESSYPFNIDECRILDEAKGQTDIDYTLFVQRLMEHMPINALPSLNHESSEVDVTKLYEIWLNGYAGNIFREIEGITKNTELKDLLSTITKLQQLSITPRNMDEL